MTKLPQIRSTSRLFIVVEQGVRVSKGCDSSKRHGFPLPAWKMGQCDFFRRDDYNHADDALAFRSGYACMCNYDYCEMPTPPVPPNSLPVKDVNDANEQTLKNVQKAKDAAKAAADAYAAALKALKEAATSSHVGVVKKAAEKADEAARDAQQSK